MSWLERFSATGELLDRAKDGAVSHQPPPADLKCRKSEIRAFCELPT